MRKYLTMKEETVSITGLCNRTLLNSLIYEENLIFFFISVQWNPVRYDEKQKRSYSKTTSPRANEELDEDEQSPSVKSMVLKPYLIIFLPL